MISAWRPLVVAVPFHASAVLCGDVCLVLSWLLRPDATKGAPPMAQTANADFSYRFLIGSGRAGSARNGGERAGAQPGRVVADAMRAGGPG